MGYVRLLARGRPDRHRLDYIQRPKLSELCPKLSGAGRSSSPRHIQRPKLSELCPKLSGAGRSSSPRHIQPAVLLPLMLLLGRAGPTCRPRGWTNSASSWSNSRHCSGSSSASAIICSRRPGNRRSICSFPYQSLGRNGFIQNKLRSAKSKIQSNYKKGQAVTPTPIDTQPIRPSLLNSAGANPPSRGYSARKEVCCRLWVSCGWFGSL